jgi:hypothetical protein
MKRLFGGTRYANVTSTLALVVALGGTSAYAINTIGSRDIRNGQVKNADLGRSAVTSTKVKDGSLLAKDFKKGEAPKGATGDKGDAGAPGAQGATGPSLPTTLPDGQTLRGSYSFSGYYSGGVADAAHDTGPADGQISFQIPLASEPQVELVTKVGAPGNQTEGPPTAHCPGSVSNPQAVAGYLCVYESSIANNNGLGFFNTRTGDHISATRFGVGLFITGPSAADAVHRTSKGSWAVTAP